MGETKEIYQLDQCKNLSREVNSPLNKTNRIRYTCYDASNNYIVCGATSGSLYLFQRDPCKFLQLIPNLYGSINYISISPQENYIAFSTYKGTILVYVIDLGTAEPIVIQTFYREMSITHIEWKQNESLFFVGDTKGNVYQVNLNSFLVNMNLVSAVFFQPHPLYFKGRNLSNLRIHPILFLESPIVQLCVFEQLLLVSNHLKCILCNTETEEYKQVGNQPRDGKFGACFLYDSDCRESYGQSVRIVCARPGVRIWECCSDGNVMQTHKFKVILNSKQRTNIRGSVAESTDQDAPNHQISGHLINLQPINGFLVVANTGNAFYIFDLIRSDVILWNDTFGPIQSIKVVGRDTILIFTTDYSVYQCRLMQLDRIFYELIKSESFTEGTQLLLDNLEYFVGKIDDLPFRYYYSILYNRILNETEHEQLLNDLQMNFGKLLTEKYGENLKIENFNVTTLRPINTDKIEADAMESSIFDSVEKSIIDSVDFNDIQMSYDDEIVVPSAKTSRNIEHKSLTEDEKIVQNLFFIYKSLRVSNIDLSERYSDVFDQYDLSGIVKLLKSLEDMILDNDRNVSEMEAKQHCAQMYVNYVKLDSVDSMNNDAKEFLLKCFYLSNYNVNGMVCRCEECEFPINADIGALKHQVLADRFIRYFVKMNRYSELWHLLDKVPSAISLAVRVLLDMQGDEVSKISEEDLDILANMVIVCANQAQFDHLIKEYPSLRTYRFLSKFFAKVNVLLLDRSVQCIRCRTIGQIDAHIMSQRTMLYSHDYVLNICADYLDGLCALEICANACNRIPSDAISNKFYLKCLLSEKTSATIY